MAGSEFPYDKQVATVDGKAMAYVDHGDGDPIVFLHGNPTSSYLWRNVMPHVEGLGRIIAPDLIGMGDSAPLDDPGPGSYRFEEHRRYLDGLFDQLGLAAGGEVTLVVHDWGSALGFDWAYRHQSAVTGIAYMEAIVAPLTWADWPDEARDIFRAMRSDTGEELVLDKNLFVEAILPAAVLRDLTDEEMLRYRAPFATPGEGRRPTLTWPREIPLDGEPPDVVEIVERYGAWLAGADTAKLFVNADPGSILTGRQRELCRRWPNQTEITVPGRHFIQEDAPDEIGGAIADWLGARA
jgi:haloalkane dehalogenase